VRLADFGIAYMFSRCADNQSRLFIISYPVNNKRFLGNVVQRGQGLGLVVVERMRHKAATTKLLQAPLTSGAIRDASLQSVEKHFSTDLLSRRAKGERKP
jgi:hypothetical protein